MKLPATHPHLTIFGGASIDRLDLPAGTFQVAGGAGLYTALGAQRAGLDVTMIGPRPRPLPIELEPSTRVLDWRGPETTPESIPRFRISYAAGGLRELEVLSPGSESELSLERLPGDLPEGPVCVIPLMDPRRQLDFVRGLAARGRWVACGTYLCGAREHPETVRAVFEAADAFFCNEEEARALFGDPGAATTRPGKLLFVTRGAAGARVVQGTHATEVAALEVDEVDPTGAGDSFCGATLAALARGDHPVEAARQGVAVATELVTRVGPRALLGDGQRPRYPDDERVVIDADRIAMVGDWLARAPQVQGFDFCGEPFPDPEDKRALDFFFAQTFQQFGFWTAEDGRYVAPLIAPAGGRRRKGSDYLWFVYRRLLERDPGALTPGRHKDLAREELDQWYRSDDGANPVPASDLHLELARSYGSDMASLEVTPREILRRANRSEAPVAKLLQMLDHIGGYKEDPLRKKALLLALVLRQRPERFLVSAPGEDLGPIVDYHIQRSCLRMGLVRIEDEELERRVAARALLAREDEEAVRRASYRAIEAVRLASGRSMAAVDWFFFQNRRRCPEMTEPDCPSCEVERVCTRRKELFQPVFRTTFY